MLNFILGLLFQNRQTPSAAAVAAPFSCETDVGGVLVSTVCVNGIWSTVVFDEDMSFDALTHSEDDARAMHDEAVHYAHNPSVA